MSDYKVPLTKILGIQNHPGADRLEIATIYGFQVIIPKDKYSIGTEIIYIPIDSLLPENIESIIFPEGSKVKLHQRRVKQIKLRGLASQGMVIDPQDLSDLVDFSKIKLEDDLSEKLGIQKYEPPERGAAFQIGKPKNRNKIEEHPLFHKFNGLSALKWFPTMFKEGEEVVIQEKLHGSNIRAALLPYIANTFWKKLKRFFRLAPAYERCYGSNNVEISARSDYTGYYGEDIYGAVLKKVNAFDKIKPNETIYGELIGPGVQSGYDYGLKEHTFVLFDVKVLQPDNTQKWLDPRDVEQYAKDRGFEFVPVLYRGPYNKDLAYSLTKGPSVYCPKQKVREGIVIKAALCYDVNGNKKALKWISEDYLSDDKNTDFH